MKSNYQKIKASLIKYQKTNPYYRIYRRKYETIYRVRNRFAVNFNAWKSMNKESFKGMTREQLLELYTNFQLNKKARGLKSSL